MRGFRLDYRRHGLVPVLVFGSVFAAASWLIAPDAPGRAQAKAAVSKRFTDQHYSGCRAARANRHESIDSWEPSYRSWMDGDDDGVACEPYRHR